MRAQISSWILLLKCFTQYVSKFGRLNSGHRTRKGQFSFQSQGRAMPNNIQTTIQLYSFHMIAMFYSKSFTLNSTVCEPRTSRHIIRLSKRQRNYRSNCRWIMEKASVLQINICFYFIDYLKAFDSLCGSQQTVENYERYGNTQTILPVSWETCVGVKKQQLKLDMQYLTGSKLGKE